MPVTRAKKGQELALAPEKVAQNIPKAISQMGHLAWYGPQALLGSETAAQKLARSFGFAPLDTPIVSDDDLTKLAELDSLAQSSAPNARKMAEQRDWLLYDMSLKLAKAEGLPKPPPPTRLEYPPVLTESSIRAYHVQLHAMNNILRDAKKHKRYRVYPGEDFPAGGEFAARKRWQSQQRQLIKLVAEARQHKIDYLDPAYTGIWWFLDQLDRPRNAAHSVVHSWQQGNRNFDTLADAAIDGMSGKERTYFVDILEDMSPETQDMIRLPIQETTRILARMGGKFAKHNLKNAGVAKFFDDIADQEEPLSEEQANQTAGFVGDVFGDPLLIADIVAAGVSRGGTLPVTLARKFTPAFMRAQRGMLVGEVAKYIRASAVPFARRSRQVANVIGPARATGVILRKGGRGIMKLSEVMGSDNLLRSTFVREPTRNPLVNKIIKDNIGYKYWRLHRHEGLLEEARELTRVIEPVQNFPVHKLAEEDLPAIRRWIDVKAKKGGPTLDDLRWLTKKYTVTDPKFGRAELYKNVRNPRAVAELFKLSPDLRESAFSAAEAYSNFSSKMKGYREAMGQRVPSLDQGLRDRRAKIFKELKRIIVKTEKEAIGDHQAEVALQLKRIEAQKEMLDTFIGPARRARLKQQLEKIKLRPEQPTLLNPDGSVNVEYIHKSLVRTIQDIDPQFLHGLQQIDQTGSAIENLHNSLKGRVLTALRDNKGIYNLAADLKENDLLLRTMPTYSLHMMSPDGLRKLRQIKGERSREFVGSLWTPTTVSDMTREFAVKGRPLSFEESERVIRAGKYKVTAAVPARKTAPDLYKLGIKRPSALRAQGIRARARAAITGEEAPLAEVWSSDLGEILNFVPYQTARSLTASNFLDESFRVFAKTSDKLTPLEKRTYKPLQSLEGAGLILQRHPQYHNRFIDEEIFSQLRQAYEVGFLASPRNNPLIHGLDTFKHWSLSYMLSLFTAFHTRNAGGLVQMAHYAGWMRGAHPLEYARDIGRALESSHVQLAALRRDYETLQSHKFFVKFLNKNMSAAEIIDIGLKNGVNDAGLFGTEFSGDMIRSLNKPFQRRTWWPGHVNFKPVQWGRTGGRFVDNTFRSMIFTRELAQGKTFKQAAATVHKYFGDLRKEVMTTGEREVATRAMWFWRWMRFNTPMQIQEVLTNPTTRTERLAMEKAYRAFIQPQTGLPSLYEPYPWTSKWLENAAGVGVYRHKDTGEIEYYIPMGWDPFFDLHTLGLGPGFFSGKRITKMLLNQLAPPLSKSIETGIGRSLFFEKQLEGKQAEMFGQKLPAEAVNWLKYFRFLQWADYMDPLNKWHIIRRQTPMTTRLVRGFTGFNVRPIEPMPMQLRYQKDLTKKLHSVIWWENAALEAKTDRDREEAVKMLEKMRE